MLLMNRSFCDSRASIRACSSGSTAAGAVLASATPASGDAAASVTPASGLPLPAVGLVTAAAPTEAAGPLPEAAVVLPAGGVVPVVVAFAGAAAVVVGVVFAGVLPAAVAAAGDERPVLTTGSSGKVSPGAYTRTAAGCPICIGDSLASKLGSIRPPPAAKASPTTNTEPPMTHWQPLRRTDRKRLG